MLVSIVVPVYNVEKYVEKCLESLILQSYKDLEIIVVDDGSTDNSGRICDEFSRKDKRIKVFHKKNGGLSSARNFGLKRTSGEFITFIDSDDFVDKSFVGKMISVFSDDVDIVECGYNNILPEACIMTGKEATIKLLIEQENLEMVAWNKLYRRSLFLKNDILYPEGKKFEDTLTTYKLFAMANKVAMIGESLYNYIERDGSITKSENFLKRLEARECAAKEAILYLGFDNDLLKAAKVSEMLAKYAYMDAAIKGKINNEYYIKNKKWILENKKQYKQNEYITSKLRFYNLLCKLNLYKIFRTIA